MKAVRDEWQEEGVAFWVVYPNGNSSAESVRAHRRDFEFDIPFVLDPGHFLVDRAEATVTPECSIFVRGRDEGLKWVYHGRINGQYLQFG